MNEDLKAFTDYCRQKKINYKIYNYCDSGYNFMKISLSKDKCVHTETYNVDDVCQSSISIWFMFLTLARNINFAYDVIEEHKNDW